MPQLSFETRGEPLFVQRLRPGRTVLGRADSCDVALPGESVSRVHCVLEERDGDWVVTDRSSNGTFVNGERVARHTLRDGDRLVLGDYAATFGSTGRDETTRYSTLLARDATHEQVVEVNAGGVATSRALLRFVDGPLLGRTVDVDQRLMVLGDDIPLPDVPARAGRIRVTRGRVMIEPGDVALYLSGARVRETTPVYTGEEIRVGPHAFVVGMATYEESTEAASFGEMVGDSPLMRAVFGKLERMAGHDAPVLLLGESGTGKELAARGLHDASFRHEGPFIAVNCAALTDTLFESELFGHRKGAFTGADRDRKGAFQQADGGTLFLDEIGELGAEEQAKLLRALESGEVRAVGADHPEFPDVRVVAATNRDLARAVAEGAFREDLYFRLAVLALNLPPLRARGDDVRLLATTLLARLHPDASLSAGALDTLSDHPWPGNVRELRNVLRRAYVMGGPHIEGHDLDFQFKPTMKLVEPTQPDERTVLLRALRDNDGNRSHAARALGMPRSTFLYKLNRYGIR